MGVVMSYSLKKFLFIFIFSVFIGTTSLAQSGGEFEITKSTVNNGGGISSGNGFVLTGSIAQTVTQSSSNGDWQVDSGFWPSSPIVIDIFKNGFEAAVIVSKVYASKRSQQ